MEERPETRRFVEHIDRELVGLYWNLLKRLCGDRIEEELRELRREMREYVEGEDRKYRIFYVTTGRKA